ncbi:NAD(P)H-binding protein [Pediococcus ethanolidurans]|uniref:NAD(P)H-binding n=1 Tax=Pediococcus ethanolidurans TaxID=319653 RepID=A0A0R2JY41_9LACO|nr:NAD(P)H-binding protein [Pediococcus ethanolidurans]KRN82129.1 saccharopine dehydrogenase related protein [Pediococcus ethanolidurans]GEN95486.1 saccharopine dehydrogenase [Pediococcus ethanolidurans]SER72597.1 NAD(P)H-binding [Pediococcus ethanolidurans]
MKLLIMAANGQIAKIVEKRILNETAFKDVELTLFLRRSSRLSDLTDNSRVKIIEGSLDDKNDVNDAVAGQDVVFVAVVDHTSNNVWTKNVIEAMKANNVTRVIFTNILGIYDEVPGEFGRWNRQSVMSGLQAAINSDKLLADSGLNYTTLRLPWLNDRNEVKYVVTHKNESYNGVSGSRQSIADVVLKIVADPKFGFKDSLGIADPATQGSDRPVY